MDNKNNSKIDLFTPKNIFVVEDEESIRIYITKILEKDGYNVFTFESAEHFISYLKTSTVMPDLILLDLFLGNMSGIDCLQFVKSSHETAHISVIILTGSKKSEIIKEVYIAGAADYLIKPIVPNLLLERIRFNLTINFKIQDIYKFLNNLHLEESRILTQPGLKEHLHNDDHCYPVLYKSHKLCIIFPKEYKTKNFIGASLEFLTTHLKIYTRNTVRWNQIWPPRVSQEISNKDVLKSDSASIQNVKNTNIPKKIFEISLDKYLLKNKSELEIETVGNIPTIKTSFWKSLIKWSEDKTACESEIELLKEKAQFLSEEEGKG